MKNNIGSMFVYSPYPPEFFFEKWIDFDKYNEWLMNNNLIAFPIIGIYLIIIFGIKEFMQNRQRLEIKTFTVIWNIFLAVCSLMGSLRFIQYMTLLLQDKGFIYTLCDGKDIGYNKAIVFWYAFFTYSKIVELVDTVIIILRKRPLTLLHVHHHISSLLMTIFGMTQENAIARWLPTLNYTVHAIMYTYFAFTVYGIKPPKWVSMSITMTQIVQFLIIIALWLICVNKRISGHHCEFRNVTAAFLLFIVLTFLLLFWRFFKDSYLKPNKQSTLLKKQT